jgi:hypothetical protein
MTRRRLVPFLAVVLGSLTVAVTAAWAGFPNIQRFDDPVLVYSPEDTGTLSLMAAADSGGSAFSDPRIFVGGIVITDVDNSVKATLTASYSATYVCVHGGVPSAANTTTLAGHTEASAVFPATRKHKATGSLLTQPLPSAAHAAATNGFVCPSGQTLEFDRAVFSNLVLAAEGGERIELHGTLASHAVYG